MKIIERYVDELLDYFPVNRITRTIRIDLLQSAGKDYQRLVDSGMDHREASEEVIDHIEGPETLAKMIPDRHSILYYLIIIASLGICYVVYQYISEADFLQVFLPTRMVFPDIIERFIQYLMVLYISYIVFCQFIRRLPQKLLNRRLWQSMLFLYSGTIMFSLYFAISCAYVWFSFNGYNANEMINGGFILNFQYSFYKHLIETSSMMYIYAIINALCFVLSKQYYHLNFKPKPYHLDEIYHPFEITDLPEIADQPSPTDVGEVISQLTGHLDAIIEKKETEPTAESLDAPIIETPAVNEAEAIKTAETDLTSLAEALPEAPVPAAEDIPEKAEASFKTDISEKPEEASEVQEPLETTIQEATEELSEPALLEKPEETPEVEKTLEATIQETTEALPEPVQIEKAEESTEEKDDETTVSSLILEEPVEKTEQPVSETKKTVKKKNKNKKPVIKLANDKYRKK